MRGMYGRLVYADLNWQRGSHIYEFRYYIIGKRQHNMLNRFSSSAVTLDFC